MYKQAIRDPKYRNVAAEEEILLKSVFSSIIWSIDIKMTKDPAEKSKQNGLGLSMRKEANGIDIMMRISPAINKIANTPQFFYLSVFLEIIVIIT